MAQAAPQRRKVRFLLSSGPKPGRGRTGLERFGLLRPFALSGPWRADHGPILAGPIASMAATSRPRVKSQHRFRELVHRCVAFACARSQSVHIEQPKASPPTLDQPRLAQAIRDSGHARPPNAQHLRNEILSEVDIVTICDVAAPQQPAREPSLDRMGRIAGGALLRLGQQEMLIQRYSIAQSGTAIDQRAEVVGTDDGCAATDLDDRSIDRLRPFETGFGSGDAIPPDRSGLHHVSGAQADDQRDDAVMRKVRRLEPLSDIVERRSLGKVDDPEARKQRLLVAVGQTSQKSVGAMDLLRHDELSAFEVPLLCDSGMLTVADSFRREADTAQFCP